MVSLQVIAQHGEQGDIPELELVRFREHLVKKSYNGHVTPVEFAEELEYLVNGLLGENIENEMVNK